MMNSVRRHGHTLLLGLSGGLATVLMSGSAVSQHKLGADPAAACAAIAAAGTIPAKSIGLASGDTSIDSAALMPAAPLAVAERGPTPGARITPAMPAYCKVLGRIAPIDPQAPPIKFQINLPADWNGRSVQYGGGGFNGVLITGLGLLPASRFDLPSPLAQGYVTVGTDSGHETVQGQPPQTFALNAEALVNFSHASYKKVRDVSVALMQRSYSRAPDKLYFVGSSEGGREGLTMAQRYPADFDGIFSRVPVINWTGLQFAGTRNGLATFGDGWLRPAQVQLVQDAVLAACDASDGVADGLVSDAVTCKAKFDVASLKCAAGQSGDGCLNEAQVNAVKTLHSPYKFSFALANGVTEYPGYSISGEAAPAFGPTGGWGAWWLGKTAPAMNPEPTNGIAWFYGSGAVKYFYARDPNVDLTKFKPEDAVDRIKEVSALMDSTNPDLEAFYARGGKLILLENMADYAQSPYAGINYHASVVARMGAEKVGTFFKLFTAPGVDHVGAGAPGSFDVLGVLTDWVERGKAPAGLQLVEQKVEAPAFAVTRARPLCEWPLWPKYKSGDAAQAASFECGK
jgi:hypothetical protein